MAFELEKCCAYPRNLAKVDEEVLVRVEEGVGIEATREQGPARTQARQQYVVRLSASRYVGHVAFLDHHREDEVQRIGTRVERDRLTSVLGVDQERHTDETASEYRWNGVVLSIVSKRAQCSFEYVVSSTQSTDEQGESCRVDQ